MTANEMMGKFGFYKEKDNNDVIEYFSNAEMAYVGLNKKTGAIYSGREVQSGSVSTTGSYRISGMLLAAVDMLKAEYGFGDIIINNY